MKIMSYKTIKNSIISGHALRDVECGGAAGAPGHPSHRQGLAVRRHLPGDGRQQEAAQSRSQGN